MKPGLRTILLILAISLSLPSISGAATSPEGKTVRKIKKRLEKWENPLIGWEHVGKIKIDSVSALQGQRTIRLFFSNALSWLPVREETGVTLEKSLKTPLGRKFRNWSLEIYTDNHRLEELIPNTFREKNPVDKSRIPQVSGEERIPLVRRISAEIPVNGLYKNNIALWPSHGWYYESKLDRWEWQRARLFGTVEDIFTKNLTLRFLVPMLENSGATVMLPVERDWQPLEVIVDHDRSTVGSRLVIPENTEFSDKDPGFLLRDTLFSGENPFLLGHSMTFRAVQDEKEVKTFSEVIPGEYAVYISYKSYENSCEVVKVTVTNAQGDHSFYVNQRMGGGTWIYLGTFPFLTAGPGKSPVAAVKVSLKGKSGEVISLDAIRFGGGMGNIARRPPATMVQNVRSIDDAQEKTAEIKTGNDSFTWKLSGKSRFREGARYYLQYAGFPDSLVYNLNRDKNDYNDDYQSRGEWVNYLTGNPNGPQKNRKAIGLKIPVDLSMAFHTDAGVTPDDSIIGTLSIYSTWSDKGLFPEGSSRMASRDLADLIQTQIVSDIRTLFNPQWTRRGLWDRQYSEAWRPNVPVMLLELLAHQNLADMRFGLDPRFQFTVARAVYKGMLRFQTYQEGRKYIVQPLPVDHFGLKLIGDSAVKLSWRPVTDPLEPTATAEKFRVYSQTGQMGFDEGVVVNDTSFVFRLQKKGIDYSFKVTALNSGGESYPSETLSVGLADHAKGTVLIVNGFDRICGPAFFDTGSFAGLEEWNDQGVPWFYNTGYTGQQYDYNRRSEWKDDDNPGWGSSFGDGENLRIPGNSFNYSSIHGEALINAGYSYVSVSDEVFELPGTDTDGFSAIDILMGEEKATRNFKDPSGYDFRIYTRSFRNKISEVTGRGGNILLSGAYVGTDFTLTNDTISRKFAEQTLHFMHRTSHAAKTGGFYSTDYGNTWFSVKGNFNTGEDPEKYAVEAPDGIEPSGENAFTAFRFGENNVSAGVAYRGKYKNIVLGFPLESVMGQNILNEMLKQCMDFFVKDTHCLIEQEGAILRMDTTRKVIYLISSADEFAEGAGKMLDILSEEKVKASFFLTGNFLRNPVHADVILRMRDEGHYIGPHSDHHLLYNAWEKRDSLLVTHKQFSIDLSDNLKELYKKGIKRKEIRYFLPPFEWYNREIAAWSLGQGLQMINFTPGTGTNADYTTPDMANYRNSEQLFTRLLNFEKTNRLGLNGAIILIHMGTHPDRKDKFYDRLGQLIHELRARGYEFERL